MWCRDERRKKRERMTRGNRMVNIYQLGVEELGFGCYRRVIMVYVF
jgi:hypothetical protein